MFKKKENKLLRERKNLLQNFSSSSQYAEAYRTLRTNLFFSAVEKDIKSIVITSAVAKEGKTTTAANFAYAISQTDRRVLLMDCDLRRPHLSSLFSFNAEKGVTSLISEVFGTRLTRGNIQDYAIGDLIQLMRLQKRTGRIDIENEQNQVAIYFKSGTISDIDWKNRPESKNLVNALMRNNLLNQSEARMAMAHQKKSSKPLGTILHTMGLVSKNNLSKALSVQAIEAIRILYTITEGSFTFSPLSSADVVTDTRFDTGFEKLYMEFADQETDYIFLNRQISDTIKVTDTPNLFILPAGPIPPNPSELLGSERMKFLMAYLKARYDILVIDTSPVMPATDAMLLAPMTDGTVLVIKSGMADRKVIQSAVQQYEKANLPIIGTVLNEVDLKKEGYYRYYGKYYASYYGKQA